MAEVGVSNEVEMFVDRRIDISQRGIIERIDHNHEKLLESLRLAVHDSPCQHLIDSIPDKDFMSHRLYHIDIMDWNKRMHALKWAIVTTVCITVSLSFLGWVGVLIWSGFLQGPKV